MEERIIKTIGIAFNQELTETSIEECVPDKIEGWDSLGFLNLLTLLEEEFDTSFNLNEIAQMVNGGDELLEILNTRVHNNNDR